MGTTIKNIRKDKPSNKTDKKCNDSKTIHKAHVLSLEEIDQNRSKAYQYIF